MDAQYYTRAELFAGSFHHHRQLSTIATKFPNEHEMRVDVMAELFGARCKIARCKKFSQAVKRMIRIGPEQFSPAKYLVFLSTLARIRDTLGIAKVRDYCSKANCKTRLPTSFKDPTKCKKKRKKKKEVMPRSRSGNFLIADRVLPRRCTLEAACSLTFKKLPKFSRAVVILG